MNFAELKTEFFARGTDYLSESGADVVRAEQWINSAYHEILGIQPWPFLEKTAQGSPPFWIADLRRVLWVRMMDDKRVLHRAMSTELVEAGADLAFMGTPVYWYKNDDIEVSVYPFAADNIEVRYIKRGADLTGTNTPIFPSQYHELIIDRAMMSAYKDSDNYEAYAALKAIYDDGLRMMAEDYFPVAWAQTFMRPSGSDM